MLYFIDDFSPPTAATVTDSPVGALTICVNETAVTGVFFGVKDNIPAQNETPLLLDCKRQLDEYFRGSRRAFDLPLSMRGSAFQREVWKALADIPYGETAAYCEIAAKLRRPNACRAVGGANNKNPIPIIVPCHRVIGKNSALVGYAGGLEIKRFLLNLEKKFANEKLI